MTRDNRLKSITTFLLFATPDYARSLPSPLGLRHQPLFHSQAITLTSYQRSYRFRQTHHPCYGAQADDAWSTADENITINHFQKQPIMSKNQSKKRKRHQKIMAIKEGKKQQTKEAKAAMAKAEGRDLKEERNLQQQRENTGEGRRKREAMWTKKMEPAASSFGVCIDCGFGDLMTFKESKSLAVQITFCYAVNKRSENPVRISVTDLTGVTCQQLNTTNGFPEQWKTRAFSHSTQPLEKVHPDTSKLVYLTSDADHTLDHLDDSKIYVIGGIVDRNRLKGTTNRKAQELGISTARLPIDDHLKLVSSKVLTVNHVFEILLKYRQHGNDWKKAMLDVLPARKGITQVE